MKISLCGYMGAGKTYAGRIVADSFGISFVDLDTEIERIEGQTINEIFKIKGENYFRALEHDVLVTVLSRKEDFVLSLGGGTPCFFDNLSVIKNESICFYLRAKPATLFERLNNDSGRPLINNLRDSDLYNDIVTRLAWREKFYMQANYIIDTDNKTPASVANEIFDIIQVHTK